MIDTHVHHWDLARFRYPWLDDAAFDAIRKNFLPADYRAEVTGGRWRAGSTCRRRWTTSLTRWQRPRGWHR
jgi:hypothetical protein